MRVLPLLISTLLVFPMTSSARGGSASAPQQDAKPSTAVACRAMEVHTDEAGRTTVVVFHHAGEASRATLSALLRAHSGAAVDVQLEAGPSGTWRGTMFRLASCFGRGLLLLPAAPPVKSGAVFHLRLAAQ